MPETELVRSNTGHCEELEYVPRNETDLTTDVFYLVNNWSTQTQAPHNTVMMKQKYSSHFYNHLI